jgi:hypothetical protein
MKLLHQRYCCAEHKAAYFDAMDRLGSERLMAARPRNNSDQPYIELDATSSKVAPLIQPQIELGQEWPDPLARYA